MKFRIRTSIGFGLAGLLILLTGMISSQSTLKLINSSAWVFHTLEVQSELQKLSTLLMTAQTNIRGYHISEQDYYLSRYHNAIRDVDTALLRLGDLIKDNPAQVAEVSRIRPTIDQRFQRWENFIKLRQEKGFAAVRAGIRGDEGKVLDERLTGALENMKGRESVLLADRMYEATNSGNTTMVIVFFGSVLALLFISSAAWIVNRDARRREEAEDDLAMFFTTSLDMLCISNMKGQFLRLSPAFHDVLGFTLEEMYKKPVLDFVHPEDLPRTLAEIEKQSRGEKIMSFENRWRHKDGSYRNMSWKSAPVGDVMYGAARDVTAQKKFEMELVEAQISSQQAVKAKSEFLANMSHEIRTPLNGIMGMTEILRGTELDPEQKRFTGIIQSSGANLLKIINEILDLSKIEAGKLELEFLDFELDFLVQSQKSLVSSLVADKKLKLQVEVDPQIPPYLRGDAGRIGQILLNLLGNAIKFTEKGEIILSAKLLRVAGTENWIHFSVQDTGIGLKPQELERLFRPFVQADGSTARKYGGTGLGLSISKRLSEMMAGSIGVESEFGKGAHFWVDLPLETGTAPKLVILPAKVEIDAVEPTPSLRILVAEDNPVNQMIIEAMLRKFGHSVQTVGNGREALQAFQDNRYDLILIDHHMPEMDGMEATALIRAQEKQTGQSRLPIIAFTANAMEKDQELCLAAGMDDIMVKPVTTQALEQTLSKWTKTLRRL